MTSEKMLESKLLRAPAGGCAIRMYRHGLGDCFLLAIGLPSGIDGKTAARQHYVLIDCGVLLGTHRAEEVMRNVANNIHEATGGRLDVLVVTHEHYDHLSGFLHAQSIFKSMKVESVWLAWTEDPNDSLAEKLRQRKDAALHSIRLALNVGANKSTAFLDRLMGLAQFHGPLGAAAGGSTRDALGVVKEIGADRIRYLRPGESVALGALGFPRVFVLGPPHDEKMLRRSRPSKSHAEVYLKDPLDDAAGRLFGDASTAPNDEPFAPIFKEFGSTTDCLTTVKAQYQNPALEWRAIGEAWREVAGSLALALDSHTNNSSLALAIELEPGGRVLLFPGDAQVGNWQSWHSLRWRNEDGEEIGVKDLLERTVVYKVGHHASHNATLSEDGLELMVDRDLVALIPVDRATAAKQQWAMPHQPLLDRLLEKCEGRVIQSDAHAAVPAMVNLGNRATVVADSEGLYIDLELAKDPRRWTKLSASDRERLERLLATWRELRDLKGRPNQANQEDVARALHAVNYAGTLLEQYPALRPAFAEESEGFLTLFQKLSQGGYRLRHDGNKLTKDLLGPAARSLAKWIEDLP